MRMPTPDATVLERRADIVEALLAYLSRVEGVIVSEAERRVMRATG